MSVRVGTYWLGQHIWSNQRTAARGVESRLLAEESLILHWIPICVSRRSESTRESPRELQTWPPSIHRGVSRPIDSASLCPCSVSCIFDNAAMGLTALSAEAAERENVRFARKNSPEMLRASHRTTTIFWPLSSCLATVLARRPSRCPLPSMTTWRMLAAGCGEARRP